MGPIKRSLRAAATAIATVVLAATAMTVPVSAQQTEAPIYTDPSWPVEPAVNPDMPQQCGLSIALVFDMSNSIVNQGGVQKSKEAATKVVDGLTGTPTSIGIYNFATDAPSHGLEALHATSVQDDGGADTVKREIDKLKNPAGVPRGGTNWEGALQQVVKSGQKYDVVYVITDGVPTTNQDFQDATKLPFDYEGHKGDNGSIPHESDLQKAIIQANLLKEAGTRVVPLAINMPTGKQPVLKDIANNQRAGNIYYDTKAHTWEQAGPKTGLKERNFSEEPWKFPLGVVTNSSGDDAADTGREPIENLPDAMIEKVDELRQYGYWQMFVNHVGKDGGDPKDLNGRRVSDPVDKAKKVKGEYLVSVTPGKPAVKKDTFPAKDNFGNFQPGDTATYTRADGTEGTVYSWGQHDYILRFYEEALNRWETAESMIQKISGDESDDYMMVDSYEALVQQLLDEATQTCKGQVKVQKQIVDADGNVIAPVADPTAETPSVGGWDFTIKDDDTEDKIGLDADVPTKQTTPDTGLVSFPLDFGGGYDGSTGQFTLNEDLTGHTDYTLYQQGGKNATCVNERDGSNVTVTNSGDTGFSIDVKSAENESILCTVQNAPGVKEPKFEVSKSLAADQDETEVVAKPVAPATKPQVDVDYEIVVKNTGEAPGVPTDIVDTPSKPNGFTIDTVEFTIDGEAVAADKDATTDKRTIPSANLPEISNVAPNNELKIAVKVTYSVDSAAVAEDGWTALNECQPADAADATKGLHNLVSMDGDPDVTDNDACINVTPEEPTFSVKKELGDAQAANIVVGAADTSATVAYKVTVTNNGIAKGAFPDVTDVPKLPEGFTVKSVTPDSIPGEELPAGESKTYEIVMVVEFDPAAETTDWTSVGQCVTEGAGTPGKGLFNLVEMEDDADGVDNNDACVTISRPAIKLTKFINNEDANESPGVAIPGADKTMEVKFLIENTGNVELTDIKLTDNKIDLSGVKLPQTTLAPGEDMEVIVDSATAPIAGGKHTNIGTVKGTPPANEDGTPNTPVADDDPANAWKPGDAQIEIVKKIGVMDAGNEDLDDADTAPGYKAVAGEDLKVTFEVTNTGKVKLTNIKVTDDVITGADAISCPASELDAGASMLCEATLKGGVAAGKTHKNTATVVGTPPKDPDGTQPEDVTDDNPAHAWAPGTPKIAIVKKINGDDANEAPGVKVPVGSEMNIEYLVTNTGDVELTDVTVTDDKVDASAISCPETELAPGAKMTCTATLSAPDPTVQHTNTGVVVGTPPANPDGTTPDKPRAEDPANAWVEAGPSIDIEKLIGPAGGTLEDADEAPGVQVKPGEMMDVKFIITNTGNVTLTDITLTDDKVDLSAVKLPVTELKPGESTEVTVQIPAPEAAKSHKNMGTVEGTPPANPDGSTPEKPKDEDPANAWTPGAPGIEIIKTINGEDANMAPGVSVPVGSDMEIEFLVKNTGDVALTDVKVTDNVIPADQISCPATELAVGAEMTCEATFKAPAEANAKHSNVGNVVGTPPANPGEDTPPVPVEDEDPAHAYTPSEPGIDIEKFINGVDADTEAEAVEVEAGSKMTVKFVIKNTGDVELSNIALTDDVVDLSGVSLPKTTLAPGENMEVEVVIDAPAAGELHKNIGKVVGTPPENPDGSTPPVLEDEDPAHAKSKEDPKPEPVDRNPAISIIKKINGQDVNEKPGVLVEVDSMMDVTFEVKNEGDTELVNVTVEDSVVGPISECARKTLAVGDSYECATQIPAPKPGEGHYNSAVVVGEVPPFDGEEPDPETPPTVTDEDPEFAYVEAESAIQIIKKINGQDANEAPGAIVNAGEMMEVTFEVTNIGQTVLEDVVVTDDVMGEICELGDMEPGQVETCTAEWEAPEAGGKHKNVATAIGYPPLEDVYPTPTTEPAPTETSEAPTTEPTDGVPTTEPTSTEPTTAAPTTDVPVERTPVKDEDPANAAVGAIELQKLINGQNADTVEDAVVVKAGDPMDISFVVTNIGSVELTDIQVTDNMSGEFTKAITCEQTSLAPGATMTCTAQMLAPKAGENHVNVGTVIGHPEVEPGTQVPPKPVEDTDEGHAKSEDEPKPVEPSPTTAPTTTPRCEGSSCGTPWWPALPLIPPLLGGGGSSNGSSRVEPGVPAPAPTPVATPTAQPPIEQPTPEAPVKKPGLLAETGANVLGLAGLGVLVLLVGLFLLRRREDS